MFWRPLAGFSLNLRGSGEGERGEGRAVMDNAFASANPVCRCFVTIVVFHGIPPFKKATFTGRNAFRGKLLQVNLGRAKAGYGFSSKRASPCVAKPAG